MLVVGARAWGSLYFVAESLDLGVEGNWGFGWLLVGVEAEVALVDGFVLVQDRHSQGEVIFIYIMSLFYIAISAKFYITISAK